MIIYLFYGSLWAIARWVTVKIKWTDLFSYVSDKLVGIETLHEPRRARLLANNYMSSQILSSSVPSEHCLYFDDVAEVVRIVQNLQHNIHGKRPVLNLWINKWSLRHALNI